MYESVRHKQLFQKFHIFLTVMVKLESKYFFSNKGFVPKSVRLQEDHKTTQTKVILDQREQQNRI